MMGDRSPIEWTDSTWNPIRGCSKVSDGCKNCYAMRQAHRSSGPGGAYEGLTRILGSGPSWTGEIRVVHELFDQPLRWRKPRRIFVNSMSDLFHEAVDEVYIASILGVASAAREHTFQVLTKRAARMAQVLNSKAFVEVVEDSHYMHTHTDFEWPLPNVWFGVSVEDQAAADERIPALLRTPAAVRWLSCEPQLGPIDLRLGDDYARRTHMLHWVVAGGESGPGARPMHPDWVRSLRDQCKAAGVPFFFKQWGNWLPALQDGAPEHEPRIVNASDTPLHTTKRAAGRMLDGRTWEEYPRG
jgi:protein gp37